MLNRFRAVIIILTISLCGGCAVGQKINLAHLEVSTQKVEQVYDISLRVVDERPYVTNGKKDRSFIGKYRAGLGNPWDVNTTNKVPLEEIIYGDLTKQLHAAGFNTLEDKAPRNIFVRITDYNFDCYVNCRVWHNFIVQVKDESGKLLAEATVTKEEVVEGSAWTGPKSAMELKLPQLYAKALLQMVLENEQIMSVLRKPAL